MPTRDSILAQIRRLRADLARFSESMEVETGRPDPLGMLEPIEAELDRFVERLSRIRNDAGMG